MKPNYQQLISPVIRELKQQRLKLGLNQGQLARKIFISRSVISRIETQLIPPSPDLLIRWADALGFEFDIQFRRRS